MNEGVYPTPAHLSGYVQERDVRESSIRFSPPTQVRARLKQEAHFRQLDYVAKSITFTYVKGTDPNHPLLSSPFLVDLNIRERTWSTDQRMTQSYAFYKRDVEEKMAYHLGNGDVIEPMPKELQTMSARLKRLETGEELLALRQEMQKPVVSVTALESYARCPFRYAMDHVLDVEKLKAEEEQVSPLELGEIIHRIIEEVYVEHGLVGIAFSKVCKEKLDRVPEWIARRFEEKWTELEKASGEMSRLDLLLAKREWEKRLEYWWKAERQHFWDNEALADMAIMALEKPVRLKVSLKQGSELILTGKVDRVDVSDAAFVIYDYKTGRAHARLEDVRSGLKLQLPLYTLALSQEMGKKEARTAEGATYISLLEPKKRAGNGIWLPDQIGKGSKYGVNRNVGQGEETLGTDEFMTKYELNERIEELWTGMKENFSVKPLECSAYCQYRAVCRVTEEKIEGSKWGKGDE